MNIRWLWASGCCEFTQYRAFGKGPLRKLQTTLGIDELRGAAQVLRSDPALSAYDVFVDIKRGRGRQTVPIGIPRDTLLGIADAVRDAVDKDDAVHRFWHWEHPNQGRLCPDCREVIDAENARIEAVRAEFLERWADCLHTTTSSLEQFLSEAQALPARNQR